VYHGVSLGFLTFTAGLTNQTQTITVGVVNDGTIENDETVRVQLYNVSGGQSIISDDIGVGTIWNNDFQILMNPVVNLNESAGEATAANPLFTLSLIGENSQGGVTVEIRTTDGSAQAGGSGLGSDDFDGTGGAFRTLTFAAGEQAAVFDSAHAGPLRINQDNVYEGNETFVITLQNASSADGLGFMSVPITSSTVTIVDDDAAPVVSISDASSSEGAAMTFTVTMTGLAEDPIVVPYSMSGGSATPITDYSPIAGSVTFAPGDTTETFTVNAIEDNDIELNETFLVTLNPPVATVTGGTGTGTINAELTFNRPNTYNGTGTPALSAFTTPYDIFTFTFPTTITGTINLTAAAGDPFLAIYTGSFNAASPLTNLFRADDDSGGSLQSQITATFTGGVTYVFVITTFSASTLTDWNLS
jgi:hypothetical protein